MIEKMNEYTDVIIEHPFVAILALFLLVELFSLVQKSRWPQ